MKACATALFVSVLFTSVASSKPKQSTDFHHYSADWQGFQNLNCKILIHHGWTETWNCNMAFTDRVKGYKQNPPIKD